MSIREQVEAIKHNRCHDIELCRQHPPCETCTVFLTLEVVKVEVEKMANIYFSHTRCYESAEVIDNARYEGFEEFRNKMLKMLEDKNEQKR